MSVLERRAQKILKRNSLLPLILIWVGGCATAPPARIQEAIGTVNRYLPEYVAEANKTFTANNHPDRERLAGIGDRMVKAVDALNRWAHGQATQTETPR